MTGHLIDLRLRASLPEVMVSGFVFSLFSVRYIMGRYIGLGDWRLYTVLSMSVHARDAQKL